MGLNNPFTATMVDEKNEVVRLHNYPASVISNIHKKFLIFSRVNASVSWVLP